METYRIPEGAPGGSGTGPQRALERRHPDRPRAIARKPNRPQRALRAQDRSRGAPTANKPQRQPQTVRHRKTGESTRGCMRRSFRTHRLCAIPRVSPRAGMRCPVGALRTPHLPRAFLRPHEAAAGTGRSEHWNVHILSPVARPRERRACPQRSLRAQDRSRRAPSRYRSPAPALALCYSKI